MKTRIIILLTLTSLYVCYGQNEIKNNTDNLPSIKGIIEKTKQLGNNSYTAIISGCGTIEVLIDRANLKYPASFTIFKKGDEVVVFGNYTNTSSRNLKMNVREFKFIQSKNEFEKNCRTPLSKDSILLENIVEFSEFKETPSVRFTLRLTNLSNRLIPAPNTHNNSFILNEKTGKFVTEFLIDGKSRGHNIYNSINNGLIYGYETLNKGGVAEISGSSLLAKDSGIFMNGNIITVQWKYMGILSEKTEIGLRKQKINDTLVYIDKAGSFIVTKDFICYQPLYPELDASDKLWGGNPKKLPINNQFFFDLYKTMNEAVKFENYIEEKQSKESHIIKINNKSYYIKNCEAREGVIIFIKNKLYPIR